ncbi:MAG: LuxR C-terminal-related transcriptional regulator [Thermomicrobiales bacterium]
MEITRRELDILKFLAAGYSSDQVANMLGVSYRMVACQLQSLSRKLEGEQNDAGPAAAQIRTWAHSPSSDRNGQLGRLLS